MALDLVKCLQLGIQLFVAGGETHGCGSADGGYPDCICAVYDAFTVQDVTDLVTKKLPSWDKAPTIEVPSDTESKVAANPPIRQLSCSKLSRISPARLRPPKG